MSAPCMLTSIYDPVLAAGEHEPGRACNVLMLHCVQAQLGPAVVEIDQQHVTEVMAAVSHALQPLSLLQGGTSDSSRHASFPLPYVSIPLTGRHRTAALQDSLRNSTHRFTGHLACRAHASPPNMRYQACR